MSALSWEQSRELVDVIRGECRAADGADPLNEATSLRLRHTGLTDGDRLEFRGTDGFLLAMADPAGGGTEITLAVRPAARCRGLGGDLLASYLTTGPQAACTAWAHGDHPAARQLAARWAFDRVRELRLLRLLGGTHPAPTPVPGVLVRGFVPADAEGVLRVNAAAFAQHPEQGAMDADNLAQRMAEPWFDPAGLLVATDDHDRVLGFHWTKLDPAARSATGGPLGEVYVIGVDPAAHGRGLGRLLLQAGLHHLASRGAAEIVLYVEADNVPALALYASLGFSHAARDTHVMYERR